jgi:cyclase
VPVIASGGYGQMDHLLDVVERGQADAVALADALHYKRTTLDQVRAEAMARGVVMRNV